MKMSSKIVLAIVVVSLIGTVFIGYQRRAKNNASSKTGAQFKSFAIRDSKPEHLRLNKDLVPPTNRWFSSVIFGETQIAFAHPFSYKASTQGFELSVPTIHSEPHVAAAPHTPDITVDLGANSYQVSAYDDLSFTSTYRDDGSEEVGQVTVTQGSPFVFVRTTQPELKVTLTERATSSQPDTSAILFSVQGRRYGVWGSEIIPEGTQQLHLKPRDGLVTFFAIPAGVEDASPYLEAARYPIEKTKVSYTKNGTSLQTTYSITTHDKQETIFGSPLINESQGNLGSFPTLYGPLIMHKGNRFTYSLDVLTPETELDLSSISDQERNELKDLLKTDVQHTKFDKTDTYYSGKSLYRAANLLLLAKQLGEAELAEQLKTALSNELSTWLKEPDGRTIKFFYYDRTVKGLVGVEPAFGSEVFNDHHFHYGYFIYAASVLAENDSSFRSTYGNQIEALIADVANTGTTNEVPIFRNYDYFVGHSWASGFADFKDGNNQESSSEAVNAWYAVYRWAKITGNKDLMDDSLWLYSNEVNATQKFWLKDQRAWSGYENYEHPFVSLLWQGKRDYATFFSAHPTAMLGIQLIPMSPGHLYLRNTDITTNLNHTLSGSDQSAAQFNDYLLMYEALANPQAARNKITHITDMAIDDANSRTYLYAWLYSR